MDLCKKIYNLVDGFPVEERYGLRSQITRAAVSIPSNIAEGSARSSDKEFKRYLEIAIGSAFELETQLILSLEVEFVKPEQFESVIDDLHKVQAGLNSLISKLR